MKTLLASIVLFAVIGCASQVDPATGKTVIDVQATSDNVDILIDAAEFFAVASMKPAEYAKFELYAEFIRKTKDRVAAKELLKQIQSGKVVVPPVAVTPAPVPVK